MKNKKFKSDVFESIHESATALAQVGGLDKTTMKGFDEACLVKTPQNKTRQIKQIREREKSFNPSLPFISIQASQHFRSQWQVTKSLRSKRFLKVK